VASQINFGWEVNQLPDSGRLEEKLGQFPDEIKRRFGDALADIETPEGVLVAVRCIDTYMTLRGVWKKSEH
jgi:hypothetical protein